MINTIEKNNYYSYYGQHNLSFKSLTAADICSKLCKGGCCDHSTVLPMALKKATDRLMGEYFKNNLANRATLPLKRIVYSWGLNSRNINALNINQQINKLIDELQETSSQEKIVSLTNQITQLNDELAKHIDNSAEIFLPITNPAFKENPAEAETSSSPNICMYKDPETNKCTIYYGLTTPEGEVINRPKPCHTVGSDEMPCPWLNPEKIGNLMNKTRALLAINGYYNIDDATLSLYIRQQHNLNETWEEKIYKPYLDSIGVKY